jgi:hypothetical protein
LGGLGGEATLLWYVVPPQRQVGWNNEYITAVGHRAFSLPSTPGDRLRLNANFTQQLHTFIYGSNDPRLPGYILSPRWVGTGYGISNNQQTYLGNDTGMDMCALAQDTTVQRGVGTWSVHIDKVNLSLPKYQGPAMRISFWEFIGGEIKEQWYFVKDVGLVRIEQKVYRDGQCSQDVDCFNKENATMTRPMTEMTLKQYMQ